MNNKIYKIIKSVLQTKYGSVMKGMSKRKARGVLFELMRCKGKFS